MAQPHPWLMPLHRRVLACVWLAVAWLRLRGLDRAGRPVVLACRRHLRLRRLGLLPVRHLSRRGRRTPAAAGMQASREPRAGGGRALRPDRRAAADRGGASGKRQGPGRADRRRSGGRRRVPLARAGGDGRARRLAAAAVATEVLDIGSGLGGPARFLAATRGLRVVGVDLTPEYVDVANELTRRCGLADRARFLTASA